MTIAYLCHIDWNWIKQRPQFLAEELSNYYKVDVMYMPLHKRMKRNLTINNTSQSIKLKKLIKLPFSGRWQFARKIQKLLNTYSCNLTSYDIIWICSPEVLFRVDLETKNKIIIYDCMDDMIEAHTMPLYRRELMTLEKVIINIAKIILVSSNSLYTKMLERGAKEEQLIKVYNATSLTSPRTVPSVTVGEKDFFTITYFGTISKWFDFDILKKLLNDADLKNVRIKLIGPAEISIPKHERLIYISPVCHSDLKNYVTDNDLFILPFVLNSITKKVDPVKLYEYIVFGDNIAAIRYPEIERFKDFVYFYRNYNELKEIIFYLMKENNIKYDKKFAKKFLNNNTWDKRAKMIVRHINNLI